MRIGFDYFNTVSQDPQTFAVICRSLMTSGIEVYIISAVGEKRLAKSGGLEGYKREIEALGVPHSGLRILEFVDSKEVPALKAEACVELGIKFMVDDRKDTCEELRARGILALNILKPLKQKSDCCGAEVVVSHGCDDDMGHYGRKCDCADRGGVTSHYECRGCGKVCDTK